MATTDDPMRDHEERLAFAAEQADRGIIDAEARLLGCYVADTGGNLTAWRYDLNSGHHCLVTYRDGTHEGPSEEEEWMAGLYDDEGDEIHCEDSLSFDDALAQVRIWINEGR